MPAEKSFSIEEATISELHQAIKSDVISSKELVLFYLERIAKFDKDGPCINSIIEINPDAIHAAEALDRELELKGPRGPLHGMPILIKDNINTGDKMHTSAGSLALEKHYAGEDAFIVEKLRNSGAVILGKTNLTEFANFMTENMPNGYSSRGGQVLNPYGPGKFDVGGSSSGSGASVACNFCAAAIGTETSGSILSPACRNSVVGIKPTLGLVSRTGIIPIAHSQDTAGPIARTVSDAALLLGAISGTDPSDPATHAIIGRGSNDYTRYLDINGLEGVRIGIPRDFFYDEVTAEQKEIVEAAIAVIEKLGAIVVEPADIPSARSFEAYDVLTYEFKNDMNAYLSKYAETSSIHTLQDIIEYNAAHAEQALKYGQTILVESQKTGGTLTEPKYLRERLRDLRLSQTEGINKVMAQYRLDAILFPGYTGCDIAARAGYPSVIVPAGYTSGGEPFGITFTGKAYSEPQLIKYAYAYEQASKKRIPPVL